MDKFRREISVEILVGLFIFTVLIVLGIFTIVLSRDGFLKKSYDYEIRFTEVGGLSEGDNVFLRGLNIGRVSQTTLNNGDVSVFIRLDAPLTLREGYRIEVANSSMLGGKVLKIFEGPPDASEIDPGSEIRGELPVDVLDQLSTAVSGLQTMIDNVNAKQGTLGKLLNDDEIYDNLLAVSEDLKVLGDRLEKGEGTIGKLLKDDGVYNDLETLLANASEISDRLVKGEGALGKLLSEDEVYDDLKELMANVREVSDRLADGEGTLGKLLDEDSTLYADLEKTMASLRNITESVEEGEGTVGKLMKDESLYVEAKRLVEEVRAAVDDMREASPISTFSSVLFGAF
ncbi:MAG: MCE family protein [Pontiellaceae bacterium]|nr:MCE family protein [Pontiellaceae bacterium]